MPNTTTRVVVNITRHETCTYELEGKLSVGEALEIIESGEEPDDSHIHSEDIDVVDLEHIAGDDHNPALREEAETQS